MKLPRTREDRAPRCPPRSVVARCSRRRPRSNLPAGPVKEGGKLVLRLLIQELLRLLISEGRENEP